MVRVLAWEYRYRRAHEPLLVALVNALRNTLYWWLRSAIDWLEPPTATSWERHHRRKT